LMFSRSSTSTISFGSPARSYAITRIFTRDS
jgi:hypothetical protein